MSGRLERWARAQFWTAGQRMRREGKTVAQIAAATGISKRKLYKHWRAVR